MNNIYTVVDGNSSANGRTTDAVGAVLTMMTGVDSLPVIAYRDDSVFELRVVQLGSTNGTEYQRR